MGSGWKSFEALRVRALRLVEVEICWRRGGVEVVISVGMSVDRSLGDGMVLVRIWMSG